MENEFDLSLEIEAREAEIKSLNDLSEQRGTPIPALYTLMHKYIANPSTVSVETFKRMIDTDDTIGSGVDFLVTCLMARIGRYEHPSNEITEWIKDALQKVDGGFQTAMKDLLSASAMGFSVQEKVWANEDHGFIIKKLIDLPQTTLAFEVERTGELASDGILQYQRGQNLMGAYGFGQSHGFIGGASSYPMRPDPLAKLGDYPYPLRISNQGLYLTLKIPIEKCVHFAWNSKANPYGRSMLRRIYK